MAYTVMEMDCPYSVTLINDPSIPEDGLLDTTTNTIQLNLAKLKPFTREEAGSEEPQTEEVQLIDKNYRQALKICSIIFHEMRHLYQKRTVEIYTINKSLGGKPLKQPESDKKCELWLREMQGYVSAGEGGEYLEQDIEADANDFAYYLTNRFPIKLSMMRTSRRLGAMKRKYDKVEIQE